MMNFGGFEVSDLVERLWASDAASALTNEAARRIERLETCLEGCLHFDDGFIKFGVLGDALNGWRNEARSLLGVE